MLAEDSLLFRNPEAERARANRRAANVDVDWCDSGNRRRRAKQKQPRKCRTRHEYVEKSEAAPVHTRVPHEFVCFRVCCRGGFQTRPYIRLAVAPIERLRNPESLIAFHRSEEHTSELQ